MGKSNWILISYLFHPLFLPVFGTFMVMWNDPLIYLTLDSSRLWINVLAAVFASTAAMPVLLILVLRKMNRVSSLENPTEQDRRLLMMFSELGFLLALLAFHKIPAFGYTIYLFILGINIALVATFILNFIQRTSFHTTGAGGLLGTAIGLMYYTRIDMRYWISGAIVLCVVVGLARYRLKAHSSFEIYLGYIVGILSTCLVFMIGAKRF